MGLAIPKDLAPVGHHFGLDGQHPVHKKDCFSAPAQGSLLLKRHLSHLGHLVLFLFFVFFLHNFILIGLWLSLLWLFNNGLFKISVSPVMTVDRNVYAIFQLANATSLRASSIFIRY